MEQALEVRSKRRKVSARRIFGAIATLELCSVLLQQPINVRGPRREIERPQLEALAITPAAARRHDDALARAPGARRQLLIISADVLRCCGRVIERARFPVKEAV